MDRTGVKQNRPNGGAAVSKVKSRAETRCTGLYGGLDSGGSVGIHLWARAEG